MKTLKRKFYKKRYDKLLKNLRRKRRFFNKPLSKLSDMELEQMVITFCNIAYEAGIPSKKALEALKQIRKKQRNSP